MVGDETSRSVLLGVGLYTVGWWIEQLIGLHRCKLLWAGRARKGKVEATGRSIYRALHRLS